MAIAIRPATKGDVPLVMQLIRDLAEYEKLSHEVAATEHDLERHLFPDDGHPAASVLIGEIDGRPQGYALYFRNFSTFLGRPGLWLEDLFVRPAARGKGLGKALLAHLASIASEHGYGRVEWAVLDWNAPAIAFYESLGARILSDWRVCRLTGPAMNHVAAARAPVQPKPPGAVR